MPDPMRELAHHVLQACATKGVEGFYPRVDGVSLAMDRQRLDATLDHLRLGGFIEIADWNLQKGQGYRATEAGQQAARQPQLLDRPAAPQPVPAVERQISRGSWDQAEEIRRAVLNPPPALATQVLVATNVLVYLAIGAFLMSQGVSFNNFLNGDIRVPIGRVLWLPGALVPLTFFGLHEWWQILTYNFVHGNLMHIGMNMYCLFTLGNVMEGRWGRSRFLILYFGSGLIAGVAVLLSSSHPTQGTVGASGAIAGLLTSLGVWAWMNRRYLPPQFVEAHFRVVGLNLLILIGSGFMIPNISMLAHVGGAIGGAILSVPLAWLGPSLPLRHRIMGIAALIAIAVGCIIALEAAPRPEAQLRQQMNGLRNRG